MRADAALVCAGRGLTRRSPLCVIGGGGGAAALGRHHFQCAVCGREYTNHRSLDHHMHVHTGKTTCLVCGAVYGRVGTLRNHVLHKHPEAAQLLAQMMAGRAAGADGVRGH